MHPLFAERLESDKRISEGQELLLTAIRDQQQALTGVRPPDPARRESYQKLLQDLTLCRGGKLYYPYLGSGFGRGPFVELLDGSVKYDFISGIGVHHFGHSHPDIIAAGLKGAITDTVMQGHLQQNADTLRLSQQLIRASGLDHCFLTTSGAMANENALKLVFQKHTPAQRLLAFERNFAGRTWVLSQVSDKPLFRESLPLNVAVDYVPFFDTEKPEESLEAALNVLNRHVARYPKQHAAMFFELIQGEGGFYAGSHDFFSALMQRCRELNIAVIVDEIQTFGRTSALFAFQHFELSELVDIVTVGKLLQVCATLFRKSYQPRAGLLSQTFSGGSGALCVAERVLQLLQEGGFFGPDGKNAQIERHMGQKLKKLAKKYPKIIAGPFGIGAMLAFTPFEGEPGRVAEFLQALFEDGVIAFTAGAEPTRARMLLPAGALALSDLDAAFEIVQNTLLRVAKQS